MLEMEAYKPRQLLSDPIYAKNDGNGPPSVDQDLSTVEPRHGHAVGTLWMHPPTFPCPALSAVAEPISQGHCRKSHDEAESIMTTFGAMGPKVLRLKQERMSHQRRRLSMRTPAKVVSQTFNVYGKRPLRKSVKDKLAFVQYNKGLPCKV